MICSLNYHNIVRFLAWNMPYHVEYHTLQHVPFHRLPELHDHMRGRHQVTSDGYVAFTRDYVALSLLRPCVQTSLDDDR